jgi:hypothetical protein
MHRYWNTTIIRSVPRRLNAVLRTCPSPPRPSPRLVRRRRTGSNNGSACPSGPVTATHSDTSSTHHQGAGLKPLQPASQSDPGQSRAFATWIAHGPHACSHRGGGQLLHRAPRAPTGPSRSSSLLTPDRAGGGSSSCNSPVGPAGQRYPLCLLVRGGCHDRFLRLRPETSFSCPDETRRLSPFSCRCARPNFGAG